MGRKRWIYTEAGRPIPGGPIEVEVDGPVRTNSDPKEMDVNKPEPKKQIPQVGGWSEYQDE